MYQEQILPALEGNLSIKQAGPSDLDTIINMLEEAASWLASRGIDQWMPGSFLGPRYDSIDDQVNRGEIYLAILDGMPAGTLTLQWEDKKFWGDVPDDAAYVHRIAIRRVYAGKGLGLRLLQWAESTAATAGKTCLRLDCMAENAALCEYYERAGFGDRGEIRGKGWRGRLYEKRIRTEA
jgi:GNAT superfamily N-acetyltransferase